MNIDKLLSGDFGARIRHVNGQHYTYSNVSFLLVRLLLTYIQHSLHTREMPSSSHYWTAIVCRAKAASARSEQLLWLVEKLYNILYTCAALRFMSNRTNCPKFQEVCKIVKSLGDDLVLLCYRKNNGGMLTCRYRNLCVDQRNGMRRTRAMCDVYKYSEHTQDTRPKQKHLGSHCLWRRERMKKKLTK